MLINLILHVFTVDRKRNAVSATFNMWSRRINWFASITEMLVYSYCADTHCCSCRIFCWRWPAMEIYNRSRSAFTTLSSSDTRIFAIPSTICWARLIEIYGNAIRIHIWTKVNDWFEPKLQIGYSINACALLILIESISIYCRRLLHGRNQFYAGLHR